MPAPDSRQVAWLASRGVAGPFRSVGGGFRTDVFESGEGRIVRVGRSPASDNTFSTERRVIRAVRRHVDVAVPRPTIVEDDLPEFPHGLMGLSPQPRRTSRRAPPRSCDSCTRWAEDFDAPDQAIDPDGLAALARSTTPRLTEAQGRNVDLWQADLTRLLARNPPPCLVHGEFWHDNWLVGAGGTITGLLDFERAGLDSRTRISRRSGTWARAFATRCSMPTATRWAGPRVAA